MSSNAGGVMFGSVGGGNNPPKAFSLSGVVRAMEQPYPDNLTGTCSKFLGDGTLPHTSTDFAIDDGAFGVSYTQRKASYGVGVKHNPSEDAGYSTVVYDEVNEWQPVRASLNADSLTAAGDDARSTRLLMRGSQFSGMGLAHAESVLIDDGAALSVTGAWGGAWQRVGNSTAPTLETGGGIAFSGAVGRAFTHDVSLSSYRYLRLRVKSDTADAPFSVSIGSKTWQAKAGTTADEASDVDIDLCAEMSETVSYSLHDTKWPVEQHNAYDYHGNFAGIVGDYLPMNEGVFFGVGRCKSMTINGSSGTAFVVERVELVRHAAPTVTLMPAFYRGQIASTPSGDGQYVDDPWPAEQYPPRPTGTDEGGISDYAARRFLLANVDGRQGLEEEDSSYVYVSPAEDGPSQVIRQPLIIKDVVDGINRVNSDGTILNPGWTATSLKPPTGCNPPAGAPASWLPSFQDCYLSDSLPATCLFGGGALAGPSGWEFGFDRPLGSYEAQMLFDEIDWYPGCGDFFGLGGGGTNGGAIILRAAAILRGAAQGLTFTPQKLPAVNASVELRQGTPAPGSIVSSGTSGAGGWYVTHSGPFAKTVQPATVKGIDVSVSVSALYGRKRKRVVLISSPNPCHNLLMQDAHYFPFTPQFSDASALPFENVVGLTNGPTSSDETPAGQDDDSSTEGT